MYLIQMKEALESNQGLADEGVQFVSASKVYYLITGRNAWHSTWVRQYYKNCISTESRELERDAERLRERGTTFQIQELPGICLETKSGCAVLTEINTFYPLKNYDPISYLKNKNVKNNIMPEDGSKLNSFVGSSIGCIADTLKFSSECWIRASNYESIFWLFLPKGKIADFEQCSHYYQNKESRPSGGSRNSLAWSIKTGKVTSEYIERLI
jgi:hypothetical protein